MKIEKYYPNRESLATIEEPYKGALMVLNMLYTKERFNNTYLSTKDVIDYYMMSCARHVAEKLTKEEYSFPSVFLQCKKQTFEKALNDNMDFNAFYVNADYEQAALFGAVYYVLTVQGQVNQQYLDYIETSFTSNDIMKYYFLPFKEAAQKAIDEQDKLKANSKDEAKKLTAAQAGLFCEALLSKHEIQYSNKKLTIPPIASKLFGYAQGTMERHGFSYTKEDRDAVADIFKDVDPEFSKLIRNFGNRQANPDSKRETA